MTQNAFDERRIETAKRLALKFYEKYENLARDEKVLSIQELKEEKVRKERERVQELVKESLGSLEAPVENKG